MGLTHHHIHLQISQLYRGGVLVIVIAKTPLYPNDLGQKCEN